MERIRRAVFTDAEAIAAVHRLSRAAYYGRDPEQDDRAAMWEHFLSQSDRITWVAEIGNQLQAFLSTHRLVDPDTVLELTAIYVHPEHFDRGIGSRLYDVFDRERGAEEPGVLEVWAGNRRAIDFYVHRGWTATDARRPGPQDAPFVTYELAPRDDEGCPRVRRSGT